MIDRLRRLPPAVRAFVPPAVSVPVILFSGFGTAGAAVLFAIALAGGALWASARPQRPPAVKPRSTPIASFENIINALPDPVLVLGRDRTVLAANRIAKNRFGHNIAGHDLARSLRDPDALQATRETLADGESRTIGFVQFVPIYRDYEVQIIPLPDHDGALGRAVLIVHDVTFEKETERMRADFVSNVSHELRSPLASLTGFIETLQDLGDDEEAQERFLGIMSEEAERMRRLIDDLLSLAKVEAEEHHPPEEAVDIADLIAQVKQSMEPLAAERGIRIEVQCPETLAPVAGDADELHEVVGNLVENAIKYARENTPVRITAAPVDRIRETGRPGVAIAVEDQGEGIEARHIPRLTERFYRVDKARSRKAGGTGLGLAIVKHIVNRHRGKLEIESEPGQGSTFTVYLPAHE